MIPMRSPGRFGSCSYLVVLPDASVDHSGLPRASYPYRVVCPIGSMTSTSRPCSYLDTVE